MENGATPLYALSLQMSYYVDINFKWGRNILFFNLELCGILHINWMHQPFSILNILMFVISVRNVNSFEFLTIIFKHIFSIHKL